MNKCAWKYYLKFVIRNFVLIFGIITFLLFVFLVPSIVYDKVSTFNYMLNSLLIFGVFVFVLSNLYIFKYSSVIKKQQLEHSVVFNDKNAKKLGYLVYLSDDWLISCGVSAVLRKTITDIKYDVQSGLRGGTSLKVKILTTNGKRYFINLADENQVQKLKLWATYSNFKMYRDND